jgi:NAD(P)-dependent dehydrogenase (short-subunit alcohol dehydrogenase family)
MSELKDKVALITGGGSGIGLAAAQLFLADGARVFIAGRDGDKLTRAAASLGGGDRLATHAADGSEPDQAKRLSVIVAERFGGIDILVNNAGANLKERTFAELTAEAWDDLLAANLNGAFHCMKAVVPQMRERKSGLIINVNSISGKRANPLGGIGYIAAKFGLRGLAMGLAAEEGANGIRVTSIYPGEVDTPILEQRPKPISEDHRRRILRPEDVAAAILFVAKLPPHVAIPELVITPASATYL